MRCSECGTEIVEAAVFCQHCGARMAASADEVASPRERFEAAIGSIDREDYAEEELWQGKFSKLAMIGSWIGAAIFSLVLLIAAVVIGFGGSGWFASLAILLLVWLGLVARLLYRQVSEHYYLTNRRFTHERGVLWRETDRIEAIDIDDVSFQQGPVERMVGVGTIKILSSDQSHPELELPGIENVKDVAAMIDEVRRQERRKRGLHIEAV
jgi:membrane protein YdbS with pleckstrin-like domain